MHAKVISYMHRRKHEFMNVSISPTGVSICLIFAPKLTKALEKKIRVGAVSYLNTKPLLHGIQNNSVMGEIELIIDYPARIANMLLKGDIDMGLVPVAI